MTFAYYVDLNEDGTPSLSNSQASSKIDNSDATLLISPAPPVIIKAGFAQQFFAYASSVTWAINGDQCAKADCGRISASGFYIAPNTVPEPSNVTLTATQTVAPFKTAAAQVKIVPTTAVTANRYAFPKPQGSVSDFGNVLDPKLKSSLTGLCSEVSLKAHAQIKIVAIGSTKPMQLADRLARTKNCEPCLLSPLFDIHRQVRVLPEEPFLFCTLLQVSFINLGRVWGLFEGSAESFTRSSTSAASRSA